MQHMQHGSIGLYINAKSVMTFQCSKEDKSYLNIYKLLNHYLP